MVSILVLREYAMDLRKKKKKDHIEPTNLHLQNIMVMHNLLWRPKVSNVLFAGWNHCYADIL